MTFSSPPAQCVSVTESQSGIVPLCSPAAVAVQAQKAAKLQQWQQGLAPVAGDAKGGWPGRGFEQRMCGQAQGLPPLWSPGCCCVAFSAGSVGPPVLVLQAGSANVRGWRAPEPRVRGPPVLSCAGAVSVLRDTWHGPRHLATSGASVHSSGRV